MRTNEALSKDFSDFIVYADESGDHGLQHIDPSYPVFVLAACIFRKDLYVKEIVPRVQEFKFRWFGHDTVILHASDIKRKTGEFEILNDPTVNEAFNQELGDMIEACPFQVISVLIDKKKLKEKYVRPYNPYNLSLKFSLERIEHYLEEHQESTKQTCLIFEKRGTREDRELEESFSNYSHEKHRVLAHNLALKMCSKQVNSSGLQIADLIATPIGHNFLRPNQKNRAYEIVSKKIYSPVGVGPGWNQKVFP